MPEANMICENSKYSYLSWDIYNTQNYFSCDYVDTSFYEHHRSRAVKGKGLAGPGYN